MSSNRGLDEGRRKDVRDREARLTLRIIVTTLVSIRLIQAVNETDYSVQIVAIVVIKSLGFEAAIPHRGIACSVISGFVAATCFQGYVQRRRAHRYRNRTCD